MNNLVHKHSKVINIPKVFVDRKKQAKIGYKKYKGSHD